MSSALVSIVIPTYNRADRFLMEALSSALGQSYGNLEVFVSDNASRDNTREVMEAVRDPRVRYHRQSENIGSAKNMNFCIQQARGDYLVVLPDDDLLDADFVESCLELAREHPKVGLLRTGTRVIDGDGALLREMPNEAVGLSFDDYVLAWIAGRTSPYQCSSMFQTAALQRVGLHSRHYLFDDVASQFKIAARYGRADLREIKGTFRLHAGELTSKADIKAWCEDSADLLQLLCELSPSRADELRIRGNQFLAMGNYRRAWRHPMPQRLTSCLTVFWAHQLALPTANLSPANIRRRLLGR